MSLQHPAGLYVWLSSPVPFPRINAALCVLANTIAHVAELTRQTKAAVKGASIPKQLLKVPKSSEAGQVLDCRFCETAWKNCSSVVQQTK